jgi:hypothetical protein
MLSPAAFNPATIPGLVEWWNPDDGATAFSDTAATTPATAGSSNCLALVGKLAGWKLESSSGPAYVTDGTNGKKVLSFNSATPNRLGFINAAITSNFGGASKQFATVMAVKRAAAAAAGNFVSFTVSSGSSDHLIRMFYNSSNELAVQKFDGGTVQATSSGAGASNTWDCITVLLTGTNLIIRRNGRIVHRAALTINAVAGIDQLSIGSHWQNSTNTWPTGTALTGSIGPVFLIGAKELSRAVIDLEQYIMAGWHN